MTHAQPSLSSTLFAAPTNFKRAKPFPWDTTTSAMVPPWRESVKSFGVVPNKFQLGLYKQLRLRLGGPVLALELEL